MKGLGCETTFMAKNKMSWKSVKMQNSQGSLGT